MTPKEKALKLCQSFGLTTLFAQDCNGGVTLPLSIAKKCALITVDEILTACDSVYNSEMVHFKETGDGQFWLDVKAEIEKL